MTKKQFIEFLGQYPDDMEVKLLTNVDAFSNTQIKPFEMENITVYSDTVSVDDKAPADEWDNEGGKIDLGEGKQYLLINPVIY